ncbi:hypothetical protein BFW01_g9134 [Lasiodiplodia theobromae]|nr:hypothetical protein BFW01_g9134 [Lasiodiplodia theobromae]
MNNIGNPILQREIHNEIKSLTSHIKRVASFVYPGKDVEILLSAQIRFLLLNDDTHLSASSTLHVNASLIERECGRIPINKAGLLNATAEDRLTATLRLALEIDKEKDRLRASATSPSGNATTSTPMDAMAIVFTTVWAGTASTERNNNISITIRTGAGNAIFDANGCDNLLISAYIKDANGYANNRSTAFRGAGIANFDFDECCNTTFWTRTATFRSNEHNDCRSIILWIVASRAIFYSSKYDNLRISVWTGTAFSTFFCSNECDSVVFVSVWTGTAFSTFFDSNECDNVVFVSVWTGTGSAISDDFNGRCDSVIFTM